MTKSLKLVSYENRSGFEPDLKAIVPVLPKRHTLVLDTAITGEAPKDFIRVYEFGRSTRKRNKNSWTPYIAKVGQKWYPNESITEYLLNRLGVALGVYMAQSKLMIDEEFGQLRFMSTYFLRPSERLEHGAEVFAGYLSDPNLVDEIERDRKTVRNYFTFQFAESAMHHRFGYGPEGKQLMADFVRMLGFDAITGNNDRHTYNWGIICDLNGQKAPRFAPVYDSARGLFWNEQEKRLTKFAQKDKDGTSNLEKYVYESMPRIGWEGQESQNHFDLFRLIYKNRSEFRYLLDDMLTPDRKAALDMVLEREFKKMFSAARYELVKKCLNLRIQNLNNIIQQIQKEERV